MARDQLQLAPIDSDRKRPRALERPWRGKMTSARTSRSASPNPKSTSRARWREISFNLLRSIRLPPPVSTAGLASNLAIRLCRQGYDRACGAFTVRVQRPDAVDDAQHGVRQVYSVHQNAGLERVGAAW